MDGHECAHWSPNCMDLPLETGNTVQVKHSQIGGTPSLFCDIALWIVRDLTTQGNNRLIGSLGLFCDTILWVVKRNLHLEPNNTTRDNDSLMGTPGLFCDTNLWIVGDMPVGSDNTTHDNDRLIGTPGLFYDTNI